MSADLSWDAFVSLSLFLPTVIALLWEFSSPGAKRIWERAFGERRWQGGLLAFASMVALIYLFLLCCFLTPYWRSSVGDLPLDRLVSAVVTIVAPCLPLPVLTALSNFPKHPPVLALLGLLLLDFFLAGTVFIASRPKVMMKWIRWRIISHWKHRSAFDETFERYRRLLRIMGRESRGGEETSHVLFTVEQIAHNLLDERYTGSELSPLLQDVAQILLDSPHRPTPRNFRSARKIFELVLRTQPSKPDENALPKDLQTVTQQVSRLARYILRNLSLHDYEEELLHLTTLLLAPELGKVSHHTTQALREIATASLFSSANGLQHVGRNTVTPLALRGIADILAQAQTEKILPSGEDREETKAFNDAFLEILYDYLTLLGAIHAKGGSQRRFACRVWQEHHSALCQFYRRYQPDAKHLSSTTSCALRMWQDTIHHLEKNTLFTLADWAEAMQKAVLSPSA